MTRLLEHYGILLAAALEAPERRLSSLPLLGPEERRRLLVDWNATARPFPHDRAIPELFGQVVTRQPQTVAVADDHRVLTYAELDREANDWPIISGGWACAPMRRSGCAWSARATRSWPVWASSRREAPTCRSTRATLEAGWPSCSKRPARGRW